MDTNPQTNKLAILRKASNISYLKLDVKLLQC